MSQYYLVERYGWRGLIAGLIAAPTMLAILSILALTLAGLSSILSDGLSSFFLKASQALTTVKVFEHSNLNFSIWVWSFLAFLFTIATVWALSPFILNMLCASEYRRQRKHLLQEPFVSDLDGEAHFFTLESTDKRQFVRLYYRVEGRNGGVKSRALATVFHGVGLIYWDDKRKCFCETLLHPDIHELKYLSWGDAILSVKDEVKKSVFSVFLRNFVNEFDVLNDNRARNIVRPAENAAANTFIETSKRTLYHMDVFFALQWKIAGATRYFVLPRGFATVDPIQEVEGVITERTDAERGSKLTQSAQDLKQFLLHLPKANIHPSELSSVKYEDNYQPPFTENSLQSLKGYTVGTRMFRSEANGLKLVDGQIDRHLIYKGHAINIIVSAIITILVVFTNIAPNLRTDINSPLLTKNSNPNKNLYSVRTSGSDLRVRAGPGTSYAVKDGVSNGTIIHVRERRNGWAKVIYSGKSGWVDSRFIAQISRERIELD